MAILLNLVKSGRFRSRVDGLSACHKALTRFEAWHHSDMSIEWVGASRP